MQVREARATDADDLTDLALRSKAYWGYDAAFIEACRAELTITAARIESEHMAVVEVDGAIAGFVAVVDDCLEDLFVSPDHIGTGIGSLLLREAAAIAREAGQSHLNIEADPNAADWYRSKGAVDIGTVPSGSIPGRRLPHLTLLVTETQ